MTSEEIIERLLDEKKISIKEALVILKDLAKIGIEQSWRTIIPDNSPSIEVPNFPHIAVTYGVQIPHTSWKSDNDNITYTTASAITGDKLKE